MSDTDTVGAGQYPPAFEDYTPTQAAALAALYDGLEAFKESFAEVIAAGIKPADALAACGYDVPLFARPMVNSLLAA